MRIRQQPCTDNTGNHLRLAQTSPKYCNTSILQHLPLYNVPLWWCFWRFLAVFPAVTVEQLQAGEAGRNPPTPGAIFQCRFQHALNKS